MVQLPLQPLQDVQHVKLHTCANLASASASALAESGSPARSAAHSAHHHTEHDGMVILQIYQLFSGADAVSQALRHCA